MKYFFVSLIKHSILLGDIMPEVWFCAFANTYTKTEMDRETHASTHIQYLMKKVVLIFIYLFYIDFTNSYFFKPMHG
jgi:hypothetical protein